MYTSSFLPEEYRCHPIQLEDRAPVEAIRRKTGHSLSAHAFASLFLWQDNLQLSLCLGQEAFFVRMLSRGENAWFFPCGSEAETLPFLARMSLLPGFTLYYLRREDVAFLEARFPGRFSFTPTRGDAEYLYRRDAQTDLKGGPYKNLRSKIHKAQKRYQWQVYTLSSQTYSLAEQVAQLWQARRDGPGDLNVALLALNSFEALEMTGIILVSEEGPQAIAFGSQITPDTFDLNVTKTLLPGLDSYLKWELYQRLPPQVIWINQEEDLDLPGLRTNKEESVPQEIVPLWKGVVV